MTTATAVEAGTAALFQPTRLGRLNVRNRIVMAPVDSVYRSADGGSNRRHMDYLAERARGGVGLIVMDNAIVRWPEGSVGSKSLRIDQDRFIASLNETVEEIHRYGALVAAQINHAGRQTTLGGSQGEPLVSASSIPWPDSGTVPVALTKSDIADVRRAFVDAAGRVAKAGFDAVQIHAAHGYLLSSFLSPALNQRTDEYGGTPANRMRIVREIILEIQDAFPDLPILARINCVDGIPNGIDRDESIEIARGVSELNIDGLDVSAGTYEASSLTFPPMMFGEAHIMDRIKAIKDAINIPVIGVGRIVRPETAAHYVANGSVDFVALGRALIADPAWVNKAAVGESLSIRHCIGCNHGCIRRIDLDLTMGCNVNPDVGLEGKRRTQVTSSPERIVVAGAGPAGIEFSLRAARSGHRVDLFEASGSVGGQLNIARNPSFKKDLGILRDHFEHELERSSVTVHTDTPLTRNEIDAIKPDKIVVATGATPVRAEDLFTVDSSIRSYSFEDVLIGVGKIEGPVTVLGGGPNGCETAIYLAQQGHQVAVLEMGDTWVPNDDHSIRDWVTRSFEKFGIHALLNTRVTETTTRSVVAETEKKGSITLPTRTLVCAAGMRPNAQLSDELKQNTDIPVQVIGDAHSVATIMEATGRAAWLADQDIPKW